MGKKRVYENVCMFCLLVIHFNLWIHPFQFMDSSISIYGFIHFNLWINPFQFMDSSISIYGFIHFNLWIQSSDYLYVVLPLITSGKRRCAKLNFKLPRTIFQIFDLGSFILDLPIPHLGQIISELTFLFSYTRTYTRYFSNFSTNFK